MDERTKKIIVKLFCVFLSFILWLYISNIENPIRSHEIKGVPVEIENSDVLKESNLVLSLEQNFEVNIRIEGPSNEIYSVDKNDFKLKVDLSEYVLKKGENTIPIEVYNYPETINIKNNNNLVVKVKVEEFSQKQVDVISKVETTFKAGFSQKSINIEPEKVMVSGPSSVLDKVEGAAIIGKIENIYEDLNETFKIVCIDKSGNEIEGLELEKEEGIMEIKVSKGKEVSIIPTYIGNLREGLVMEGAELSLSKVIINGEIDAIDGIHSLKTEDINLSNINSSQDIEVKINVPDGVSIVSGSDKVTIKIKIRDNGLTTKEFYNLNINYIGMKKETYKYELPSTVNLTLLGIAEELIGIDVENIKIEANLGELTEGEHIVTWKAKLLSGGSVKIVPDFGEVIVKITRITE